MEVHHPHHVHHKKKWKEYLLEFFMLFFAVSLGFFVENQREHYIEREREHELARNLYVEMKDDSVDLEKVINFRIKKEKYLDILYNNFYGDSDNDSIQKVFQVAEYIGVAANSAILFEPRNAIISELSGGGMMRYFKSEVIQTDIHNIINMAEKTRHRMQRESDMYEKFIMPLSLEYRNSAFLRHFTSNDSSNLSLNEMMEQYLYSKEYLKYPKRNIHVKDLNAMRRSYEYYRFIITATRKNQLLNYQRFNTKLLNDLRVTYHF